jgi:hypothetical protein
MTVQLLRAPTITRFDMNFLVVLAFSLLGLTLSLVLQLPLAPQFLAVLSE